MRFETWSANVVKVGDIFVKYKDHKMILIGWAFAWHRNETSLPIVFLGDAIYSFILFVLHALCIG